jgi:drug/metabolite transporter (DMT)-like permease
MKDRLWLVFALTTALLWGVWGALIEIPEKAGFPATLGYTGWALTTIPCAVVALALARWKLDWNRRSTTLGFSAGLLGSGGQLILFEALRTGPAYLVFPIISIYPVVTVFLSAALLKERANRRAWAGIVLALAAMPLLSYQPHADPAGGGRLWLPLALCVFVMWGLQAFLMKLANSTTSAESVFFYLMAASLTLAPAAVMMTDFSRPVNWGFNGPCLAAAIQSLNAAGTLLFVYAIRYGKAIIVAPMTALAPLLTIILSLGLHQVTPHPVVLTGMVLAAAAIYLMAE